MDKVPNEKGSVEHESDSVPWVESQWRDISIWIAMTFRTKLSTDLSIVK